MLSLNNHRADLIEFLAWAGSVDVCCGGRAIDLCKTSDGKYFHAVTRDICGKDSIFSLVSQIKQVIDHIVFEFPACEALAIELHNEKIFFSVALCAVEMDCVLVHFFSLTFSRLSFIIGAGEMGHRAPFPTCSKPFRASSGAVYCVI